MSAVRRSKPESAATLEPVRAVQYLRMSTEHQRYSLAAQAAAVGAFAAANGYILERSYVDSGRSGLTLRERPGLQALIAAALDPERSFSAILVLDISRWGRFQDPDQSAHYEFLCREAGARVVYCGEPFADDGSAAASLLKHLKRMMAAEYSRELSAKVIRAQLQQAALGFHQGGPTPYGVRRRLVDPEGRSVGELACGVKKGLAAYRVMLTPGPPEERRVVRWIFRRFLAGAQMKGLAADLNRRGVPAAAGRRWTPARVRGVLTNPLMVGTYVFNRTRQRLDQPYALNDPTAWVRRQVMPGLVSRTSFAAAQARLAAPHAGREAALVEGLRALLTQEGVLTRHLVETSPLTASVGTYRRWFGTLSAAYAKAGFNTPRWRWRGPGAGPVGDAELLARLAAVHESEGAISGRIIDARADLPSRQLFRVRFGSLTRAYALAGLPAARRPVPPRRGARPLSDAELLARLRNLHARDGYISMRTIRACPDMPSGQVIVRRFGSMLGAYEQAGLPHDLGAVLSAAHRHGVRWARPRAVAAAPTGAS